MLILPTLYVVCACLIIYSVFYTFIKLIIYLFIYIGRNIFVILTFSLIIILYFLKLHFVECGYLFSILYLIYME